MLRQKKYDFSQDAGFREDLLLRCRLQYEKARKSLAHTGLADDELELVTAAGNNPTAGICPYPGLACADCERFVTGGYFVKKCRDGYLKAGG